MKALLRQATQRDSEFIAWAMLAASRAHLSRGVWDLVIGSDDIGCIDYLQRLAVAEPRSLCHFENFVIADVDGRPAATLCTFDPREGGWATVATAMSNVQRDLRWSDSDDAASQGRTAAVWRCLLPEIGADWIIENVATLPTFRGHGLAQQLLEHVMVIGTKRGCKLAQVTTYIGNTRAERTYRRAGFAFMDEKQCADLLIVLGAPGFVRFVRRFEVSGSATFQNSPVGAPGPY